MVLEKLDTPKLNRSAVKSSQGFFCKIPGVVSTNGAFLLQLVDTLVKLCKVPEAITISKSYFYRDFQIAYPLLQFANKPIADDIYLWTAPSISLRSESFVTKWRTGSGVLNNEWLDASCWSVSYTTWKLPTWFFHEPRIYAILEGQGFILYHVF